MRIGAFEMELNLRPHMKFELEEKREKRPKLSLKIVQLFLMPKPSHFPLSIMDSGESEICNNDF